MRQIYRKTHKNGLTPDVCKTIRDEIRRTGFTGRSLFKSDTVTGAAFGAKVNRWIAGLAEPAAEEDVAYALAKWAAVPTLVKIELTAGMTKRLEAEIKRTDCGPYRLFNGEQHLPAGLNPVMIAGWLNRDRSLPISQAHWDYVVARYAALPDVVPQEAQKDDRPHKQASNRPHHRPIVEETFAELSYHRARTGLGVVRLMKAEKSRPDDFSETAAQCWLTGVIRMAVPEHVAYLLDVYRQYPSADGTAYELSELSFSDDAEKDDLGIKVYAIRQAIAVEASRAMRKHHLDPVGLAKRLRLKEDQVTGILDPEAELSLDVLVRAVAALGITMRLSFD